MQREARIVERVEEARVRSRQDHHPRIAQHGQGAGGDVLDEVTIRHLLRGGARGALDAPVVGGADARPDIGQAVVVRVIVQVQIGQCGRAVEGRRHRRAQLPQAGIDAPRRRDVEGVGIAPHGLGVGILARQIVGGDGRLILRTRLHGVV
ncbi:hypothetical protein D3C80_1659630 [compost metagenome]